MQGLLYQKQYLFTTSQCRIGRTMICYLLQSQANQQSLLLFYSQFVSLDSVEFLKDKLWTPTIKEPTVKIRSP